MGSGHEDRGELSSPPVSPLYASEGTSGGSRAKQVQGVFPLKPGHPPFRKCQDSSLDADDTESELVAIPESDMSDSTMQGCSAPVSFAE